MPAHCHGEPRDNGTRTGNRVIACFACLLLCTVTWSGAVQAIEDDYLKAIQAEIGDMDDEDSPAGAEDAAPGVNNDVSPARSYPGNSLEIRKTVNRVDSMDEFEQLLHNAFPGSYFLMKKLPADEQQAVYKEFLRSRSLPLARQMIVELARARN